MNDKVVFLIVVIVVAVVVMFAIDSVGAQDYGSGGVPRGFGEGAFLNDVEVVKEPQVNHIYYYRCHWIPDHTKPDGGTFECWWTKFPPQYQPDN